MSDVPEEPTEHIDRALSDWRQGDCVTGEHWFVLRRSEGEDGLDELPVDGLVVVSQTCDVVRSVASRPYVDVSPLMAMPNENHRKEVRRGRVVRYGSVPGVDADGLVADLDRTMTVHKEVVAGWKRVPGWSTDAEARLFADVLARKRRRFAFPDEFTRFVRPLQDQFKAKHDKQSAEGEALRALLEIRVQARPSWTADAIDLDFFLVCALPDKAKVNQHVDTWRKLLTADVVFRSVGFLVMTLDEITAAQYLASDALDLENLSWSR